MDLDLLDVPYFSSTKLASSVANGSKSEVPGGIYSTASTISKGSEGIQSSANPINISSTNEGPSEVVSTSYLR